MYKISLRRHDTTKVVSVIFDFFKNFVVHITVAIDIIVGCCCSGVLYRSSCCSMFHTSGCCGLPDKYVYVTHESAEAYITEVTSVTDLSDIYLRHVLLNH